MQTRQGRRRSVHDAPFPHLATLFAVLALAGALFTAWATPPFQGADEPNHFHRAVLLTRGELVGQRLHTAAGRQVGGGLADPAVDAAAVPWKPLAFHPERKVDPDTVARTGAVRWTGRSRNEQFSNTAVYPPLLYLPQTAAIAAGQAAGLPVILTLKLARTANAVVCVALSAAALLIAGRRGWAMAAVLGLPMSVFLFGTVTQDGMIIALSALGAALVLRPMGQGRPMREAELWGAAACFALVGMAKPPYSAFGLLLLAVPTRAPQARRIAAALAAPLLALAWGAWMNAAVWARYSTEAAVDPSGQVRFLFGHPEAWAGLAWRTLSTYWLRYLQQLIGILGWLDARLPAWAYLGIGTALAAALAMTWSGRPSRDWRFTPAAAIASALAAAALVFVGLYLQWTPVGRPVVEGVQGRYLIPVLLFLPLAWAGGGRRWTGTKLGRPLARLGGFACAGGMGLGLAALVLTIVTRYYGP